jgi:hypothetical protein
MKYSIFINQLAVVEMFPQLLEQERPRKEEVPDLIDLALFDYIRSICISDSPKLKRMESDGKIFTWLDYGHLIENMPLLGIRDKSSLSRRIKKLRNLGLIETLHGKGFALFVRLAPKAHDLEFKEGASSIADDQEELLENNASVAENREVLSEKQRLRCGSDNASVADSATDYSIRDYINNHRHSTSIVRVYDSNSHASNDDDDDHDNDDPISPGGNAEYAAAIDAFYDYTRRVAPLSATERAKLREWMKAGYPPEAISEAVRIVFEVDHPEKIGDHTLRLGYIDYKISELGPAWKRRLERESAPKCRRCSEPIDDSGDIEFGICGRCLKLFRDIQEDEEYWRETYRQLPPLYLEWKEVRK